MRMALVAGIVSAAMTISTSSLAQQSVSSKRMIETFRDFPIVCTVPEDAKSGCSSIEEFVFLTNSKGISVGTLLLEIGARQYLRVMITQPLRATANGFCAQGAQPIKDSHMEIVQSLKYLGNFSRTKLSEDSLELVQKQFINPMIALFGSSTVCTKFQIPENRARTNELTYQSYLDGELLEQGRVLLYSSESASELKFSPVE